MFTNTIISPRSLFTHLHLHLLLTLLLLLLSTCSADTALSSALSLASCPADVSAATSPFCPPGALLSDTRGYARDHGQCRTLCLPSPSSNSSSITTVESGCTPRCSEGLDDTCVPQSVCAATCGPPPPNCVYSGTCGSLHCFPSSPFRVTHSGIRSLLSSSAQQQQQQVAVGGHVSGERCELNVPTTVTCSSKVTDVAGDGRRTNGAGMCRAACHSFTNPSVEVISLRLPCTCAAAARTAHSAGNSVCVPSVECEAACGPLPDAGCFYSGDCAHVHCASAIDSKLSVPVSVSSDDASVAIADSSGIDAINERSKRSTIDPPVFASSHNSFVTLPPLPPPPTTTTSPSPSAEDADGDGQNQVDAQPRGLDCVAAVHLETAGVNAVYTRHRRAAVLCDVHGSCATPGHIVVYQGVPLTMAKYCAAVKTMASKCSKTVMDVNSPRYVRALRVPSNTQDLAFTTFAARYETKAEAAAMAALVRIGL